MRIGSWREVRIEVIYVTLVCALIAYYYFTASITPGTGGHVYSSVAGYFVGVLLCYLLDRPWKKRSDEWRGLAERAIKSNQNLIAHHREMLAKYMLLRRMKDGPNLTFVIRPRGD